MNENEIREKIVEIALYTTGAELSEGEELKESGLDSLSLVTLIVSIEEEFGFSFGDDELQPENLRTLNELVRLTEKHL